MSLLQQDRSYTAPPSVILELVWVLQVNDCTRGEIVKGLRALCGLPNFKPMAFDEIDRALGWFDAGMDFGDAMHLTLSASGALIPPWLWPDPSSPTSERPFPFLGLARLSADCHATQE